MNTGNEFSVLITEFQNWVIFCPEVQQSIAVEFSKFLLPWKNHSLAWKVFKETGKETRSGIIECTDLSQPFMKFLRAALLVSQTDAFTKQGKSVTLPSVKSLAKNLDIDFRDFLRNENRIAPFRLANRNRRVTEVSGYERSIEWVLCNK